MIPFDWGLQYDPRGFLFISEMVSGIYVVQFDEDLTRDTTILRYGPLKMMIEMRRALLVALLLSATLVPMASAHGANDFSIIMRGSSIQPSG